MQMNRVPGRLRLGAVAAAALLSGALLAPAPVGATTTATFLFTGSQQQFVVPAGVRSVHVLAVGGRGGTGLFPVGGLGGAPAEVSGDVAVLPGQTLYVEVGGPGTEASFDGIARAFNGGSYGGRGAAGGGGASDIRLISRPEPDSPQSLLSRLIAAGGAGGGGAATAMWLGGNGGNAGSAGTPGSSGDAKGGGAGTQEAGGIGGCANHGCDGTLGSGHEGAAGLPGSQGGGGGGGLFGGAGGDSNGTNSGAGGGGGSSLVPIGGKIVVPAVAEAPEVQISYTPPSATTPGGPASARKAAGRLSLLHPVAGFDRSITLVLDVPRGGALHATASIVRRLTVRRHGRRVHVVGHIVFGTAHATASAEGPVELVLRPSAAARRALEADRELTVSVSVSLRAPGRAAETAKGSVVMRGSRR